VGHPGPAPRRGVPVLTLLRGATSTRPPYGGAMIAPVMQEAVAAELSTFFDSRRASTARVDPLFCSAVTELERFVLRGLGDFTVGVAAFPEGHHRSPDLDTDAVHFVEKLRAGADYAITQMFFRAEDYLRLRDRVVAVDAEQGAKPIVPGIMPVTSLRSVHRMAELSGQQVPREVVERLERAAGTGETEDREAVREVGVQVATELAERLIAEGVPCLHFYTLNFARATREVLGRLGLATARA
jgi:methylenetetrahydrofolate reductase (NADPH)